jgi:hypothetical protein
VHLVAQGTPRAQVETEPIGEEHVADADAAVPVGPKPPYRTWVDGAVLVLDSRSAARANRGRGLEEPSAAVFHDGLAPELLVAPELGGDVLARGRRAGSSRRRPRRQRCPAHRRGGAEAATPLAWRAGPQSAMSTALSMRSSAPRRPSSSGSRKIDSQHSSIARHCTPAVAVRRAPRSRSATRRRGRPRRRRRTITYSRPLRFAQVYLRNNANLVASIGDPLYDRGRGA